MTERILFVDDEPMILEALRRQLRRRFELDTAVGSEEGLTKIRENGPYEVVVSDMRMPGLNGAQFLAKVREENPDTVCLILSGQAEIETTIEAVNSGNIFRFLTKPCPEDALVAGLETALDQHRLAAAEKQLLEQTLSGAVKVLTDVLSLVNPEAFSRASRVRHYAEGIAERLTIPDRWEIGIAAMLSHIGCVTLPQDTLARLDAGQPLSEDEREMFDAHPEVAGKLISAIPRLERVASMIAGQREHRDTSNLPQELAEWPAELRGAKILQIAIEFDMLLSHGTTHDAAIEQLRDPAKMIPAVLVDTLLQLPRAQNEMVIKTLSLNELRPSMILDQELKTKTNVRLIAAGHEVTQTTLARLHNFAKGVGIEEPIRVRIPV